MPARLQRDQGDHEAKTERPLIRDDRLVDLRGCTQPDLPQHGGKHGSQDVREVETARDPGHLVLCQSDLLVCASAGRFRRWLGTVQATRWGDRASAPPVQLDSLRRVALNDVCHMGCSEGSIGRHDTSRACSGISSSLRSRRAVPSLRVRPVRRLPLSQTCQRTTLRAELTGQ
jgi:hypothetical protein